MGKKEEAKQIKPKMFLLERGKDGEFDEMIFFSCLITSQPLPAFRKPFARKEDNVHPKAKQKKNPK